MSVILPLRIAVGLHYCIFPFILGHVYVYFPFLIAVVGHMPFYNKNFLTLNIIQEEFYMLLSGF